MATIKDVARAAGVSPSSVSRVLTGHPATSEEMRERVVAVATALNFRPNAMARSLRNTSTRTIGLVVSDLLNPFFTELARAVEDSARAAGYAMIVGNADEDPAQQDHYVRILLEQQVDGLIVVPTVETSPLLHEAAAQNRHLVLVDRPAQDVEAPSVLADGTVAIDELVDHLAGTGRRDPAIVTGPEHAGTARQRLEEFRAAWSRHGVELAPERIVHGDFRASSGADAMAALLDTARLPDAVFIANGPMALGALQVVRSTADRVRIPDDVAFAVFDDMPWFTLLAPTVTAIAQPTARLGERAMRMLLDRIAGVDTATVALECRLMLRESTGSADDAALAGSREER